MKKNKCASIAIICLAILIALTAMWLCGCSEADNTASTNHDTPKGYALVYHPDGEERIDFVKVHNWSDGEYKIDKADGSCIVTKYATIYYYPET